MLDYRFMDQQDLVAEKKKLEDEYRIFQSKDLKLDMSRGKPSPEQVELSNGLLDVLNSASEYESINGVDCRNYGVLDGIPEIKELFSPILGVPPCQIIVGGNSSLHMMFDTISCFMTHGVQGGIPWIQQGIIKFLCPVPGYDRHFSILSHYGITPILVPMKQDGPDMDMVETLVAQDDQIKGIWCVPKYSNPEGITYSDDVVRRFSKLRPAAQDFRIFWDNAYAIHDLTDHPKELLNLMQECEKVGNSDLPILFCSTSKITFPGSGVAALAASDRNLSRLKERYFVQTIGYDKINQLRHVRFLKDYQGMLNHMNKHKQILKPKFKTVLDCLDQRLAGKGIASWTRPEGGYFISVDVKAGCAKRVVELCKNAGVVLTAAGATYPNRFDPQDKNIRIAPTYPSVEELNLAMELFCICVSLAALEKMV